MGCRLALAVVMVCACAVGAQADEAALRGAIETVQAVGNLGHGNSAAQKAWPVLASAAPEELPTLLAALDDSNPLAANWIRGAIDAVCEKTLTDGAALPAKDLETFALDTSHKPKARRLAFEWLAKVDTTAPDRLIPGMLNDPSVEFRRDAVARLLEEANTMVAAGKTGDELKALYRKALGGARDLDQVQTIAGKLKEQGDEVDLSRHFGFLYNWQVIGPFDNVGEKGFAVAYPPEKEIDLAAEYPGKSGPVKWQSHLTVDEMGTVDLNVVLIKEKGVCGYALTEFESDKGQDVELRWGTVSATKLWLNGELLAEHEIYHAGEDLDQYSVKAHFKPGKNVILMKVCQNEQTENWTEPWRVALRVCDPTGTAILSADRPEKTPKTPGGKL